MGLFSSFFKIFFTCFALVTLKQALRMNNIALLSLLAVKLRRTPLILSIDKRNKFAQITNTGY